MILDLDQFVARGEPRWRDLASLLDRLEERPEKSLTRAEVERLADLYCQTAADLNRIEAGAIAPELRSRLSGLVARAYAEIYGTRRRVRWSIARGFASVKNFALDVPRVFRRRIRLFYLALAITLAGVVFGALAVSFDASAAEVLLPFDYLQNPAQRVAQAEGSNHDPGADYETAFSGMLISHNIQVSLLTLALGVTAGVGTSVLLFTNGVMIGAVAARYLQAGFGWFLAGWLLPHGAFEIPSVLIAGQAGFVLASLLLAGGREPRRVRLRRSLPEVLTLFGGLSCLLVWAGIMEAFFSQHHAPEIRYSVKALVGVCELLLLFTYLARAGARPRMESPPDPREGRRA